VVSQVARLGVQHITKTALESGDLVRQVSLFAFRSWAEQRRNKELQFRRQAESMLLLGAEIAHEFKSVITSAALQFRRIRTRYQNSTLSSDALDKIASQLETKIRDGLTLSEVLLSYGSLRGYKPKYEDAELGAMVREIVERDDSSQFIRVSVAQVSEVKASVDVFLVRRVLAVLLRNIVDHCPIHVHVNLSVGETQYQGVQSAFIDVEDDGDGIPVESWEKVFEPGERCGKEIRYYAGAGLGLGLAFARVLIELHGGASGPGSIRCIEPISLRGARFRIILPQVAG
jgi:signal transduction histidine kinase